MSESPRQGSAWIGSWPFAFLALFALVGLAVAHAAHPPKAPQGTAQVVYGPQRLENSVYPRQHIPLKFNHGQHLALGQDCVVCHSKISTSRSSRDNNFPGGATCDGCHGSRHPHMVETRGAKAPDASPSCATCHTHVVDGTKVTASLRAPTPRLLFNHELHGSRGIACEQCHGDMKNVRLATNQQLPREAICLDCHDGKTASDRCQTCHLSDRQGKLVTRDVGDHLAPSLVPRGRSSHGAEHDLAFVEDHAGVAKGNPELCAGCHGEAFCQDCHNGVVRPMRLHAGDYLTTHALDAKARLSDCDSCHRGQTDCRGCHERLGLGRGPESRFGVGSNLRFHPEGWAGTLGTRQEHAFAAQRNLNACVACHDEDSCMGCHATATGPLPGSNISPHGASFAATPRCQALAGRNRRVCLKCHAPGTPELDCR